MFTTVLPDSGNQQSTMESTVKIIYIAGSGRSGTTIMDRVLGTLDGVTSLNQIYPFGEPERRYCSCGDNVGECPFWTEVMQNSAMLPSDTGRLIELREKVDHTKYLPLLFTKAGRKLLNGNLQEYLDRLRDLYSAIAVASEGDILVDSSKVASRALILSMISEFEVYVVHMVRDARGVLFSWQKKKERKGGYLTGPGMGKTLRYWITDNIGAEMLSVQTPYTRVRYEDFAECPRKVVAQIQDAIPPISTKSLQFIDERSINLGTVHSISGNPDRFHKGETTIRVDDQWKESLEPMKKMTTQWIVYPLLRRYDYV